MFRMGMPELVLIFLVVLLLFGGKRITEIARGIGTGIKEFKKSLKDPEPTDDFKRSTDS